MELRSIFNRPVAPAHDDELAALRQQLAAADQGLAALDVEQRRLLDQIAARERVLHRADDAAADQARRKEAERRAALMAERDATAETAQAAYRELRTAGIALLALRDKVVAALRRHEEVCRAVGAPMIAHASDGELLTGKGRDLPDFHEWGEA